MDVAVDASVLIAIIVNEPEKPALIRATIGDDLISPHSVRWEIGNAFSAMLKRGRVTREQATKALAQYASIPIRYVEVELDDSLAIADQYDVYAYDAYLLRCAVKYRAPLLSLDRGLLHVARQMNISTVEVP